jgi:hypothetical protein
MTSIAIGRVERGMLTTSTRGPKEQPGRKVMTPMITVQIVVLFLVALMVSPTLADQTDVPPHQESTAAENVIDIKAGQKYEGGTRVRVPLHGMSFVIPQEWIGSLAQSSQFFLLESNSKPGLGIVVLQPNVTPEELIRHMNEQQVLDENLVLQPVGRAQRSGDRIAAAYQAGENVGRALAVLGPAQAAIVYLFMGPKTETEYYDRVLGQITNSTQFTALDTASVTNHWHDLLAGMMLKRLEQYSSGAGGGYNMSTVWHLCRDGRFSYMHSSHVTVNVPGGEGMSSADEDVRHGRWRVEVKGTDALLILTEDNGAVRSHALAYDGEKTYLDNQRVFRVASEEC